MDGLKTAIVATECIYIFIYLFFSNQMGSTVCYPSDDDVQVTPLAMRASPSQLLFRV